MKNITVSVENEVYRRARMRAAEQETSVSALVSRFLTALAADENGAEKLAREERALRERIDVFRAADRVTRDELHGRSR